MDNLFYKQLQEQSDGVDLNKFAIKELENISVEIKKEFKISDDDWTNGYDNGLKVALTKVENRIEELKGEQ